MDIDLILTKVSYILYYTVLVIDIWIIYILFIKSFIKSSKQFIGSFKLQYDENPILDSFIDDWLMWQVYKYKEPLLRILIFFFVYFVAINVLLWISIHIHLPEFFQRFFEAHFLLYPVFGVTLLLLWLLLVAANVKFKYVEPRSSLAKNLNVTDMANMANNPERALMVIFPIFENFCKEGEKSKFSPSMMKKFLEKKLAGMDPDYRNKISNIISAIFELYRNPLMHSGKHQYLNQRTAQAVIVLLDELTKIMDECEPQEINEKLKTPME